MRSGRRDLTGWPLSRTGENSPYGILGEAMETSASFEARYAPSPYPTGATVIYWTYGPLVARNAHLNFNRLGVRLAEYVEDMYGITDSTLHGGVPTDRLIVAWPTHDAAIEERLGEAQRALASVDCRMAPVATKAWIKGAAGASILPHCIRVAIPTNAESLLLDRSPDAAAWRLEVRRGIQGHSSDKGPIRRYPTLTLLTPRPYLKTPDPLRSSQPACNDADKGAVQEKFRKREGWSRDQAPPRPAPRGHPGRDRSHGGPTRQAEESGRRSWEQPQGPRCC